LHPFLTSPDQIKKENLFDLDNIKDKCEYSILDLYLQENNLKGSELFIRGSAICNQDIVRNKSETKGNRS
jgi:hypothetical protein